MAALCYYMLAAALLLNSLIEAELTEISVNCISTNNNLHHECEIDSPSHKCTFDLDLHLCKRTQDWSIAIRMDGKLVPDSGDYKGNKVIAIEPIGDLRVKVRNTGLGRSYLNSDVLTNTTTINIIAMDVYDSTCDTFIDWFRSQSVATLVTCGIGIFLVLLVLISIAVYFCYCRGKEGVCRRLFVIDGVNEFITSTVPYVREHSNFSVN